MPRIVEIVQLHSGRMAAVLDLPTTAHVPTGGCVHIYTDEELRALERKWREIGAYAEGARLNAEERAKEVYADLVKKLKNARDTLTLVQETLGRLDIDRTLEETL